MKSAASLSKTPQCFSTPYRRVGLNWLEPVESKCVYCRHQCGVLFASTLKPCNISNLRGHPASLRSLQQASALKRFQERTTNANRTQFPRRCEDARISL